MPWVVQLILFVSLMLLSEYYFFRRFFSSIKFLFSESVLLKNRWIKIAVLTLINLVPVYLLGTYILRLFGGPNLGLPDESKIFDYLFYYPFWVSILIVLQAVVLILPIDLIRLVLLPIKKLNLKGIHSWIIIAIVALSTIYVPLRILIDMTQVEVRSTIYEYPNLHKDLKNLKIGVVSDIQADWYNSDSRITEYLEALNEESPEIVFIPGDMITHDQNKISVAAEHAGKIKTEHGVFACVGDHDNWAYGRDILKSRKEVIDQLSLQNVKMLDNQNLILRIDSSKIGLTFITDTYSDRVTDGVLDSLTRNLLDVDFKIMVTHQPNGRTREAAVRNNYNLMLSGHTHGGQVTLLFPFIGLTPTLFETKYVKGDFWFNDLMMVVNGGLGMSLAPIRYNSTPEVTIINLK